jgi:DNA-binding PadR family transcriptional regulator
MDDLTAFQRDVLFAIAAQESPHYRAIKRTLSDYYEKRIYNGHDRKNLDVRKVFPNLDTLIEKGLVEKEERQTQSDRYWLTDDGWAEIDARRAWERQCLDGGQRRDGSGADAIQNS